MTAWRNGGSDCKRHGIAIEHEQRWPQGTYSLYFRDPAGNSVELIDNRHYPQLWERLLARHRVEEQGTDKGK
jgi:catechol-2,3-dioxygenase